jgi:hypothetical protein
MTTSEVERLIEHLEHVRKRPAMYLGAVGPEATARYLDGFRAAVSAIHDDPLIVRKAWWAVSARRGFKEGAKSPDRIMTERGLTPAQITDELLQIDIALLRALLSPHELEEDADDSPD